MTTLPFRYRDGRTTGVRPQWGTASYVPRTFKYEGATNQYYPMSTPFDRLREVIWPSLRLTDEDGERTATLDGIIAGYEDPRSTSREELLHDEARTVLEHQLETLDDIDDKAARTVRITALLVGAVFGAISFGDASSLIVNQFTWWGSASLLLAVALGMTTYSQSSPYFGPKPSDWTTVLEESDSVRGDVRLLVDEGYRGWINANSKINRLDSYFLLLTQWSIATSLILFGTGLSLAFASDQSFVPRLPSFVDFSYHFPFVPFPLTPASLPVFVLSSLATVTYVYSLVEKSRLP